jgi:hypothetical protein
VISWFHKVCLPKGVTSYRYGLATGEPTPPGKANRHSKKRRAEAGGAAVPQVRKRLQSGAPVSFSSLFLIASSHFLIERYKFLNPAESSLIIALKRAWFPSIEAIK